MVAIFSEKAVLFEYWNKNAPQEVIWTHSLVYQKKMQVCNCKLASINSKGYTSVGQFKIYRLVNANWEPTLSSFLTTFMNAPKPQSTTLSEEQVLNSWLISLQLDIFSYSEFIILVLEFSDYLSKIGYIIRMPILDRVQPFWPEIWILILKGQWFEYSKLWL